LIGDISPETLLALRFVDLSPLGERGRHAGAQFVGAGCRCIGETARDRRFA
jgi:hypothetical protein